MLEFGCNWYAEERQFDRMDGRRDSAVMHCGLKVETCNLNRIVSECAVTGAEFIN